MPELTTTAPYVHSRVDSDTFTMDNLMPEESILSPSQGLWIWPQDKQYTLESKSGGYGGYPPPPRPVFISPPPPHLLYRRIVCETFS